MKYGTWTWPDIGEGRPHTVVAEVAGAVETPDGLVDATVLVTACGRTRPAEGANVVEADEAPENLHGTCAKANGRLLARGRSRSIGVLIVGSPVLGVPEGVELN